MMIFNHAKAIVQVYEDDISVYFADKHVGGGMSLVEDVVMKEYPTDGTVVNYPLVPFRVTREAAQKLVESLWEAGVRPQDARDRSGEIQALKDHIASLERVISHEYSLETVRVFDEPHLQSDKNRR